MTKVLESFFKHGSVFKNTRIKYCTKLEYNPNFHKTSNMIPQIQPQKCILLRETSKNIG